MARCEDGRMGGGGWGMRWKTYHKGLEFALAHADDGRGVGFGVVYHLDDGVLVDIVVGDVAVLVVVVFC